MYTVLRLYTVLGLCTVLHLYVYSVVFVYSVAYVYSVAFVLAAMHLHYGDLTDSTCLVKIISQVRPHEIYNLGAQSHVKVGHPAYK